MDVQQAIFDDLMKENRGNRVHRRDGKTTTNSKDIRRLLEGMYNPVLPPDALCFHVQDAKGLPLREAVIRNIGGEDIACTVAFTNELSAKAWEKIERPSGFFGPKWPPETVDDLLGCSTLGEPCVECEFGDKKDNPHQQYEAWSAKMYDFWLDKIRLSQISEDAGLGLRALEDIYKNTCIGEYTGELVPGDSEAAIEHTQYHYDIPIGRMAREGNADSPSPSAEALEADTGAVKGQFQTYCWLDASRRGSVFRFMNHSCEPNAKVQPGRCGAHNRILYVYTTQPIRKHEQITISYGDDWLSTPDERCFCGTESCKNPPDKDKHNKEKEGDGRIKKTRNEIFKDIGKKTGSGRERRIVKNTENRPTRDTVDQEMNDIGDEVMQDAKKPQTDVPRMPGQTHEKKERQSNETSGPAQMNKQRVQKPPAGSPALKRRPRRLRSQSPGSPLPGFRSPKMSPNAPDRITKPPPRRGPIEPESDKKEDLKEPRIRQKTYLVPKSQKKAESE
ncbi:hypothetical protein DE146DRAFT_3357 [Phaeosphaeria sp. MPI-PUGE-AT-0046c]|nr:hypothetical protein DE146DRAFT_3357 [Phaeosphaeria sp. MPI-PUGE-AT-0046c]